MGKLLFLQETGGLSHEKKNVKLAVLLVVLVFITIPLTAKATEIKLIESEPVTLCESFTAEEQQMLESINPVFTTIYLRRKSK